MSKKAKKIKMKKDAVDRYNKAAIIIQKWTKSFIVKRLFDKIKEKRYQAAKIIQIYWRERKERRINNPLTIGQITQAAVMIQKYYRQLKASKQLKLQQSISKMIDTFEYFDSLHNKLLVESQIIIRSYWLRYHKRQKMNLDLVKEKVIKTTKVKRRKTHTKKHLTLVSKQRRGSLSSKLIAAEKK
mmetsp:Transcript_15635/g.13677  ORF Transcript_15635/g.13677 Transcript_15635/m.13677 type:complete len:185 (-) Transcript_15635:188-742(-)